MSEQTVEIEKPKRMSAKVGEIATEATAAKKASKQNRLKKLDVDSIKLLETLKERANRKTYGRKVRDAEIIAVALKQVTAEHLEKLKDATLSEEERIQQDHATYQRSHGRITYQDYLGKLRRGELVNLTYQAGETSQAEFAQNTPVALGRRAASASAERTQNNEFIADAPVV